MAIDSIPARLFARAERTPDAVAFSHREQDAWVSTTWRAYADEVRAAAKALVAEGFEADDTTCILGFNRPEWVAFDVATMAAGGTPAGIYTTCSPGEVQYIVDHSDARIVLVEDHHQLAKIEAERERLPKLERVVLMRGAAPVDDPLVLGWEAWLELGANVDDDVVTARLGALRDDQVATFIYTSGTTGPPKAVMLSHRNLTWTADAAVGLTDICPEDDSVSYLPLAHIAEQMFTVHVPITVGSRITFAESIDRIADNLREIQPTVIFGVPRIWEKMHAKVSARLAEATGVKRRIADWSMNVGRQVTDLRNHGVQPSGLMRLKYRIAGRLVFDRVKPLLGLGNARHCITGAAPISSEILDFFAGLDLTIHEVYGQSEDTGPTSFNTAGATRYGTVGRPIPNTEVAIAEDGEIRVRGPHVFLGYYKDVEATSDTLQDGWLLSGDLGAFDDEGFLCITGRKKEILITAGGKNIAPKNIEAAIKNSPLVSQAVVIGDRRKYLSSLVTLDPEAAESWAAERGLATSDLHAQQAVRDAVQGWIDDHVNPQFARVEHVRKFTVLPRDFSVDEGELTPTLKIKRRAVDKNFADEIEAMYQGA